MNNTPPKSFFIDFIHCKIAKFFYTSKCLLSNIPHYYNYDINVSPIIWLPFFTAK